MNLRASLAAFAALVCGCGAPTAPTASSSQPIEVRGPATFNQVNLNLALGLLQLNQSQFTYGGGDVGVATFTPSSALSQAIWQDPNGADHALSFDTPYIVYDPGALLPTVYISVSDLHVDLVNDLQLSFGPSELDVDAALSGTIHAHTAWPWPDADLVVDRMAVHIALTFDTQAQLLRPTVTVNLQDHVENCGAFDWCDGVVHSSIPDMSGKIASALQQQLTPFLADPAVTNELNTMLTASWNAFHQGDFGGGPGWAIVPGSISLVNSQFQYQVERSFAPSVAPDCSANNAVQSVSFFCKSYPQQHSGGATMESVPQLHAQVLTNGSWVELGVLDPVSTAFPFPTGTYSFRLQWQDAEGQGPWSSYTARSLPALTCAQKCVDKCGTFEGCKCAVCQCPPCSPPAHLHRDPDGTCMCEF